MRITQMTPGTGSFLCGACLRDHEATLALRKRGHDVSMLPLYLPFALEGPQPRSDRVFMGGINLYLQQQTRLLAHLPGFVRRWLDRPKLLAWSSTRGDMTNASRLGSMTWSMMKGREGRQAVEINRFLDWLEQNEQPDVIVLSNALLIGLAQPIIERLGAPVVCTLHGEDTFLDALTTPWKERCWDVLRECTPSIARFVAVSAYHAETMGRRLSIPPDKLAVVHNGIDPSDYFSATSDVSSGQPTVGYLARLCRDKGLHILIEAFVLLKQRGSVPDLKLRVAGSSIGSDVAFVQAMNDRLAEAGCADDASITSNVSRSQKLDLLRSATVFSVPATYGESFGLYALEAMAAGVPLVQPRHAAFPEILERSGAGLLCEPDDAVSLADKLETILLDRVLRSELGSRGRDAVSSYFNADRMAADLETAYAGVLSDRTNDAASVPPDTNAPRELTEPSNM